MSEKNDGANTTPDLSNVIFLHDVKDASGEKILGALEKKVPKTKKSDKKTKEIEATSKEEKLKAGFAKFFQANFDEKPKKGDKQLLKSKHADAVFEHEILTRRYYYTMLTLNGMCNRFLHELRAKGFPVEEGSFMRDYMLISNLIGASMLRSQGIGHQLQGVLDGIFATMEAGPEQGGNKPGKKPPKGAA